MGMKKFLLFAIFLISLSFLISNAKAVTYISGCSDLNQSGETYYLTADIIDSSISPCISISANNIILDCQNHVIDGVDAGGTYGIYADNVQNVTIKNCLLTDWDIGLCLSSSSYNKIINLKSNSSVFSELGAGIYLEFSSNNQIINSTSNFNVFGILLLRSEYNSIINSTFLNNIEDGVDLDTSNYNKLENIYLSSFQDLSNDGIFFISGSNYNNITNITIANASAIGINIGISNNNTISYSKIMNCGDYGIYLHLSQDNLIYNNLFNNTNNFHFTGTIYSNYWNTTKQLGQRIYSPGNYIGGNYWTNPEGNGYSDTCTDDDRDGFCDLPYDLLGDGTNVDYLPLSDEYSPIRITIFSPLNQSYYGSIDFAFKATDDFDENFTVRTYLNNQLEYENLNYSNNTQTSYSKTLPTGTYNFTVYAEDSYGASSKQEVFFTSLGYCGDSICQADYESPVNCSIDCILPLEITIFSPLNQSYYGSIDFAFKVIDYSVENFTVRTYLNNQLEYENLYYQNNTQISYSKSLPMGTYNFTVYAEDSYGVSSKQEVVFTSLGYCGDSICQADYENNMNCFKDCGGTARQFTVGIGSVVLAFGGLMLLATAFASSPTEGKDYVFKIFMAVIGIILMVYGIIYLINL
jgi:parallel beta-helix repeat protein